MISRLLREPLQSTGVLLSSHEEQSLHNDLFATGLDLFYLFCRLFYQLPPKGIQLARETRWQADLVSFVEALMRGYKGDLVVEVAGGQVGVDVVIGHILWSWDS
jgi:hypothetical protein